MCSDDGRFSLVLDCDVLESSVVFISILGIVVIPSNIADPTERTLNVFPVARCAEQILIQSVCCCNYCKVARVNPSEPIFHPLPKVDFNLLSLSLPQIIEVQICQENTAEHVPFKII